MSSTVVNPGSAAAYGAVAPVTPEAVDWPEKQKRREDNLWKWNVAMCILHLVQAVVALALSFQGTRGDFKLPLIFVYNSWARGFPETTWEQKALLPFAATTTGFAFMSSFAHFLVLVFYKEYLNELRSGINKFRWYEYAFSSSLMIALIALVFGIYDIMTLVAIMSVNACMNLFGYLHEAMNAGKPPQDVDWTAFWFGCFAGAVPWAIIIGFIAGSPSVANIPDFVWGIFAAYIVMFNLFPINMVLQYRQVSWWSDRVQGWPRGGYFFGEKVYQVLSLVSKSLLLWLVFGGTNQPNRYTTGARSGRGKKMVQRATPGWHAPDDVGEMVQAQDVRMHPSQRMILEQHRRELVAASQASM